MAPLRVHRHSSLEDRTQKRLPFESVASEQISGGFPVFKNNIGLAGFTINLQSSAREKTDGGGELPLKMIKKFDIV